METVDLIKNEDEIEIENTKIKMEDIKITIEDIKIEEIGEPNYEQQSPNTKNNDVTVQSLLVNQNITQRQNLYNKIFCKLQQNQSMIFHACNICSEVCASPEELTEHLKTIHRPLAVHFRNTFDVFFCDTCQILHREIIKENHWPCNAVDIKCFFCLASMPLENHFVNHALTWHHFRQFQCNYCNVDTKKYSFFELNAHMKLHNKLGVYKCVRCKVFYTKYLLELHIELCHNGCTCLAKICCCKKFNEEFYMKKIRKIDVLDKNSTPISNIICCSTENKPEETPRISDICTYSSSKSSQINSNLLEIKSFDKNFFLEQSENSKDLQMANTSENIPKNHEQTKSKISLRNINELRENTNENLIFNSVCSTDKVHNSTNFSQSSTQLIKNRHLNPSLIYSKPPKVIKSKKDNELSKIIKKSENKISLKNKTEKLDISGKNYTVNFISNNKLIVDKTKNSRDVFHNGEQNSTQNKQLGPNLTYLKQFKPTKNNELLVNKTSMQNSKEQENANKRLVLNSDKAEAFTEKILQNGGRNLSLIKKNPSQPNLTYVKQFKPTKNNELNQIPVQNNKERENAEIRLFLNADKAKAITENILEIGEINSTKIIKNSSKPVLTYAKRFKPTKNNKLLVDQAPTQNNREQESAEKHIFLKADKAETCTENILQNGGRNSTLIKNNPIESNLTYVKRFEPTKSNKLIQISVQNNKEQENAEKRLVLNADKAKAITENILEIGEINSTQIIKNPSKPVLTYAKRFKSTKNNKLLLEQTPTQNNKHENTDERIVFNADKIEVFTENILQNGGRSSKQIKKNPLEPNLTNIERFKSTKNNELDQTSMENNKEQENTDEHIVLNAVKTKTCTENILQNDGRNSPQIIKDPAKPVLTYGKRFKPTKSFELNQISVQNNKEQENTEKHLILNSDKAKICTENIFQNGGCNSTLIKKNPTEPNLTYVEQFTLTKNNELNQIPVQNNKEQEKAKDTVVLNADKEETITENIQNGRCNATKKQEIIKPKLSYLERKELKLIRYCVVCNLKFGHPNLLGFHCIRMHRPWALEMLKDVYCPICNSWFESEEQYIVHYPCKRQTITDTCPLCLMNQPLKEHFDMHCVIFNHYFRVVCTLCEENSKEYTMNELNKHRIEEHKQNGVYECLKCKITFSNTQNLKRHIVTDHNKNDNENLANVYKLKLNSKYHFKNYLKCSTCHKIYFSKGRIKKHKCIDVHLCSTCGQTFKDAWFLKAHENKHSKTKSYDCTKCDKKFLTQRYLLQHTNIHKNKKIYSCGLCSKNFVQMTSLIYHMSSHTKENIFKCYICDILCDTQKKLSAHMKIHNANGTNPHKCKICDKYFSHKCNLLVHMRVHPKTSEEET